jgi:hypothetical protein
MGVPQNRFRLFEDGKKLSYPAGNRTPIPDLRWGVQISTGAPVPPLTLHEAELELFRNDCGRKSS